MPNERLAPPDDARVRLRPPGSITPDQATASAARMRLRSMATFSIVGAAVGATAAHFSKGNTQDAAIAGAALAPASMYIATTYFSRPGDMGGGVRELLACTVASSAIATKISGGNLAAGTIAGSLAAVPIAYILMGVMNRLWR